MKISLDLGIKNLECFGDSKLIVMQLLGKFKAKNSNIFGYHKIAKGLADQFAYI